MRTQVKHPAFQSQHATPTPPPPPIFSPPEPQFLAPETPSGVGAMFGKKKHELLVQQVHAEWVRSHEAWQRDIGSIPGRQFAQQQQYEAAEVRRREKFAVDQQRYDQECADRQTVADTANLELDSFIRAYEYGAREAVEDFLELVLSQTEYPEAVDIHIDYEYSVEHRELDVKLRLPKPDELPAIKTYRYVKSKDEITEVMQTAKEQRDRYTSLAQCTALRMLHEVFSTDAGHHIDSVSLLAHVKHIDPATGRPTSTPLIAVAADRATFDELDLAHVTPAETLKYLRAVVSKNLHALVPIDTSNGIRG